MKIFHPKFQTQNNDNITLIRIYNPNHNSNLKKFHSCLDGIKNKELKTCFQKIKVLLSTIQPLNFHKLLTTAKFERLQRPKQIKKLNFFLALTESIMKMVILKNVCPFRSNLKTNCSLGTINVLLLVTVKMFYIYLLVIIAIFSILDKVKN